MTSKDLFAVTHTVAVGVHVVGHIKASHNRSHRIGTCGVAHLTTCQWDHRRLQVGHAFHVVARSWNRATQDFEFIAHPVAVGVVDASLSIALVEFWSVVARQLRGRHHHFNGAFGTRH